MANRNLSQLKGAMRSGRLVRFSRRFEEGTVRGYVLDIGPRFFLLALMSDRVWFDGFECFRIGDVKKLTPDNYARFAETALKKRGERKPKKPRVSVKNVEELLRSAAKAFPLVTIHREKFNPDVCWIGRVVGVGAGRVSLLEIGPDAKWEDSPTEYRLSEITRVNFGGDYEAALYLVGGDPKVV